MANFCLTPQFVDLFKKGLKSGEISPEKLASMSSEERHSYLADFVGEENAKQVNSLFESKLLLKNQQAGMVSWASKVAGLRPEVRSDLISKIEKLDTVLNPADQQSFLADLASTKLGVSVTPAEAKYISESATQVSEAKAAIPEDAPIGSESRLDYGTKYALLQKNLGDMKNASAETGLKDFITHPKDWLSTLTGTTKSVVASLDNSFFGRQGIKMLFSIRNADIWANAFVKSWGDIGKELKGQDAILPIKADIYSRPNALNGNYQAGKFAVGIDSEEEFPSSLPERIPVLGRLFKASESAYNGAALRMRADYADRVIALAEKQGIDTGSPEQMIGMGHLVNSMTGRGDIGKLNALGKEVNAAFFSIKFLKSNFDVLTAHQLDSGASKFAKTEAVKNLAGIITSTAAVMFTANQLWPGSVELDPRSSNFGKIKIGNTKFDVSGGMAPIITLASRIIPTESNGEWGFMSKSPTTGVVSPINSGKYGASTAMDVVDNFWQGKLSPVLGAFVTALKGKDYNGNKPTAGSLAAGLVTPFSLQNFAQLRDNPNSANLLAVMIADGLGISQSTGGFTKTNLKAQFGDGVDSSIVSEFSRLQSVGAPPTVQDIAQSDDKVAFALANVSKQEADAALTKYHDTLNKDVAAAIDSDKYKNAQADAKKTADEKRSAYLDTIRSNLTTRLLSTLNFDQKAFDLDSRKKRTGQ